ncbi:MAG TPA: site-2 protease family protein [Thermoguttaceae bacterium]|nr:site-2 protease family protein [Thermoguttaceae bacterium]
MSDQGDFDGTVPAPNPFGSDEAYIIPTVVEEPRPQAGYPPPRRGRRVRLPLLLFIATCLSTFMAGGHFAVGVGRGLSDLRVYFDFRDGLTYGLAIMTILVFHEMGHFLQARRYGVRSSFPFFLPMPISPLGTLGAVIAMEPRIGDRKALFDIGITGPLAGLVPTLVCCVVGVQIANAPAPVGTYTTQFGDPLLLKLLYQWRFGPLPAGWDVPINPVLWAGWVGLLVTSLNLIPIGQLDGGHVLYAIMRKRAHLVATLLLLGAAVAVIGFGYVWWTLMLVLLVLMGPKHPPTAGDDVPLGTWRYVLGWLMLAFIVIGFTPTPFVRV